MNYSKVSKLAPKKKKHTSEDSLAKADGLDRSQILEKRRRSDKLPDESDTSFTEFKA